MCSYAPGNSLHVSPESFYDLLSAIRDKNYPCIYGELDRHTGTFSAREASRLLTVALESNLRPRIFGAILERSPPMPDIISANTHKNSNSLLDWAARARRADVLSLFIERGASPNRRPDNYFSPLEIALNETSPSCVKVLLRQPDLDTSWTDSLLQEWAWPCDPGSERELCLRAMAPRFTGWDPGSGQPLPIPEPMTPDIIASCCNWPMLERFCRERSPVPLESGRSALDAFKTLRVSSSVREEKEQTACAGALAALLDSCPGLLEGDEGYRQLLLCFACFVEAAQDRLRPWVESLGPRRIAMDWANGGEWYSLDLPAVCRALPPGGPVLVLDRWSDFFDPYNLKREDLLHDIPRLARKLGGILDVCPIRGQGRKGELSPLARTVLLFCSASLVESLSRSPNGLLAAEDPVALIDFVQGDGCPRVNRAAALAHIHNMVDYNL